MKSTQLQYNASQLQQQQAFLTAINGDKPTHRLIYLGDRSGKAKLDGYVTVPDVAAQDEGYGVFVTPNEFPDRQPRNLQNLLSIRAVWVDVDGGKAGDLRGLPEPSIVVKTCNGYHYYWLLANALDASMAEPVTRVLKYLAEKTGGDPNAAKVTQPMRVPGTWHLKEGVVTEVKLISLNPGLTYTLEDLAPLDTIYPPAKQQRRSVGGSVLDVAAAKIRDAKPGNRNGTVYQACLPVGNSIAQGKLNRDAAFERLVAACGEIGLLAEEEEKTLDTINRALDVGVANTAANPDAGKVDKTLKAIQLLRETYEGRISLNDFSGGVLLDGDAVQVDKLYITVTEELGFNPGKELVTDVLVGMAETARFSPVANYLQSLPCEEASVFFADAARRFFGTAEAMHQVYLRKWAIGTVARALEPGCQMDTALVLQGSQGIGKTTFFRELGGDFFSTMSSSSGGKDEVMVLRKHWIVELGEIEHTFNKRAMAELKAFITETADAIRVPYGRQVETFKRHCVLVGTTNESQFLNDSTGNRRFWVIPVSQQIPSLDRDEFWAAAMSLYQAGERWCLSSEQQEASNALNAEFEAVDAWAVAIERWASKQTKPFTTEDALVGAIDKSLGGITRAEQTRAGKLLSGLGYEARQMRIQGCKGRFYEPKAKPGPEPTYF